MCKYNKVEKRNLKVKLAIYRARLQEWQCRHRKIAFLEVLLARSGSYLIFTAAPRNLQIGDPYLNELQIPMITEFLFQLSINRNRVIYDSTPSNGYLIAFLSDDQILE